MVNIAIEDDDFLIYQNCIKEHVDDGGKSIILVHIYIKYENQVWRDFLTYGSGQVRSVFTERHSILLSIF